MNLKACVNSFIALSLVVSPFAGPFSHFAQANNGSNSMVSDVVSEIEAKDLVEPLRVALVQKKELLEMSWFQKGRSSAEDVYSANIRVFGDRLGTLASDADEAGRMDETRVVLAAALRDLKASPEGQLLNNPLLAKSFERDLNKEIKRQSRMIHPVAALASGVVVGAIVGVIAGAASGMKGVGPDGAHLMTVKASLGLMVGSVVGGGVFVYFNDNGNIDRDQLNAAVNSALSADDELYNLND